MAAIRLDQVSKAYAGHRGAPALEPLTLDIADGEFMVLVGPSGCGKSTALRCIAGLERPSSGRIIVGDREVQDLPPGKRDLAMVFQGYALYPHLTVYRNLAFPLKEQKVPRAELDERVRSTAQMLELTPYLDRRPGQLSGGQRQRVAMGRALVRRPQAFLMDEPLSNLDAQLRSQMRSEVADLHRRMAITSVYVTHDQVEAMTLGHRIAVLRDGRLQQVGPPTEVYACPANVFVAGFLGTPAMNLLTVSVHEGRLGLPGTDLTLVGYSGAEVTVGVRPESVLLNPDGLPSVQGSVVIVEELGNESLVHATVRLEGHPEVKVVSRQPPRTGLVVGSSVRLGFRPEALRVFHPTTGDAVVAARVALPA